jgi:hypothetical protein
MGNGGSDGEQCRLPLAATALQLLEYLLRCLVVCVVLSDICVFS